MKAGKVLEIGFFGVLGLLVLNGVFEPRFFILVPAIMFLYSVFMTAGWFG